MGCCCGCLGAKNRKGFLPSPPHFSSCRFTCPKALRSGEHACRQCAHPARQFASSPPRTSSFADTSSFAGGIGRHSNGQSCREIADSSPANNSMDEWVVRKDDNRNTIFHLWGMNSLQAGARRAHIELTIAAVAVTPEPVTSRTYEYVRVRAIFPSLFPPGFFSPVYFSPGAISPGEISPSWCLAGPISPAASFSAPTQGAG